MFQEQSEETGRKLKTHEATDVVLVNERKGINTSEHLSLCCLGDGLVHQTGRLK